MTDKPHPKTDDDHHLLVLFHEWLALTAAFDRLLDEPVNTEHDRQAQELNTQASALAERICALRARTLHGLRAKARIVAWLFAPEPLAAVWPEDARSEGRLAYSLVNDVLQMEALT